MDVPFPPWKILIPTHGCLSPSLGATSPCCRSLSQLQRILSLPWTSYLHSRGSTPTLILIPALDVLSPPLGVPVLTPWVPVPISRGSISTPGVPVTIPGSPIPAMVVPVPTLGVLSSFPGFPPHPEGSFPGFLLSPFWGFRPYPRSPCPHHGVPSPLWECLSPC